MWKKGGISRKAIIILFTLLLTLSVGGGFNKAFADQDIQSRLTDWFDSKRNESISEMDKAITAEKNRLMDQLRVELQLEMQRAQAQLAQHTANETAQQISELQKYAAELSAGINVSTDAEKKQVSSNISAALEEAKSLLKSSAVAPKNPEVPSLEKVPDVEIGEAGSESTNTKPVEPSKTESVSDPSSSATEKQEETRASASKPKEDAAPPEPTADDVVK